MQPTNRIQANIVNRQERRILDWACSVMPEQVTSDHLTLMGVCGAVLAFAGYVAERDDPRFLWLAAFGYLVHWAGDSLDGSLARFRNVGRPRYGYFLDHSVDAFCILMMVGGMGLSSFVRMDVALFVVVAYFALSIHVFLKNHVTGTFQLSFMALGPTELRMVFVAVTLWMYAQGGNAYPIGTTVFSSYDLVLLLVGTILSGLFVLNTLTMIVHLRGLEGDGRQSQAAFKHIVANRQPLLDPAVRAAAVTDAAIF